MLKGSVRWNFSNFGCARSHDLDSLNNCRKTLGQCGKTVPSFLLNRPSWSSQSNSRNVRLSVGRLVVKHILRPFIGPKKM